MRVAPGDSPCVPVVCLWCATAGAPPPPKPAGTPHRLRPLQACTIQYCIVSFTAQYFNAQCLMCTIQVLHPAIQYCTALLHNTVLYCTPVFPAGSFTRGFVVSNTYAQSPFLNPHFRYASLGFAGTYEDPFWTYAPSTDWRGTVAPPTTDQGACGKEGEETCGATRRRLLVDHEKAYWQTRRSLLEEPGSLLLLGAPCCAGCLLL